MQITTIGNSSPATDAIGSAVCFTLNLPLLLIATIEVLHRVNTYAARRRYNDNLIVLFVRFQQLVLAVAGILYIVAGVQAGSVYRRTYGRTFPADSTLNQVATIMTIIIFGIFVFGNITLALLHSSRGFVRERALLSAVILATPLLIVRLVFAILAHLVGQRQANPLYGSLGLRVGLGFLMEILAVIVLVVGGLINLEMRRRRLRGRQYGHGTATTESSSRGTESTTETSEASYVYEVVSERRR